MVSTVPCETGRLLSSAYPGKVRPKVSRLVRRLRWRIYRRIVCSFEAENVLIASCRKVFLPTFGTLSQAKVPQQLREGALEDSAVMFSS
jgi:hypothetical protein